MPEITERDRDTLFFAEICDRDFELVDEYLTRSGNTSLSVLSAQARAEGAAEAATEQHRALQEAARQLAEAAKRIAELEAALKQSKHAHEVAIGTVDCPSIDRSGTELPWYVGAKLALGMINAALAQKGGE
jgi:hypothetical protein